MTKPNSPQWELRKRILDRWNIRTGELIHWQNGMPAEKAIDDIAEFVTAEREAAVREFAEKLKKKAHSFKLQYQSGKTKPVIWAEAIDQLVEEERKG